MILEEVICSVILPFCGLTLSIYNEQLACVRLLQLVRLQRINLQPTRRFLRFYCKILCGYVLFENSSNLSELKSAENLYLILRLNCIRSAWFVWCRRQPNTMLSLSDNLSLGYYDVCVSVKQK